MSPDLAEALAAATTQAERDLAWDEHTQRTIATLRAHVDPNPPHVRPLTTAQLAAIDAAESLAEDRAFFGRYGGTDREADHAALVEENRSGRQVASALDWLERGGVR